MKEVILVKDGELALKGLNRSTFEDKLIKNIRRRLSHLGKFHFEKAQSTISVMPENGDTDLDEAAEIIGKVFGIVGYSRAALCDKDFDTILKTAEEYLYNKLEAVRTFKVESKRSDKKFPYKSPEISREAGAYILKRHPHLKVDVHNPDLIVYIEVRDRYTFIHGNQEKGAGGMPVGTNGKGMLLISGGIDSPVAGWMMAKRGIELAAVHFASPPYTSKRAEMKVHELLRKVAQYSGRIKLYTVRFTEIQEAIRDNCPEDTFTLVMRRHMMRIASMLAEKEGCQALITGESVGQVASQTIYALGCTDKAAAYPVFRPCIGMDKTEIIEISRKIDTFDISIEPYEDCCTVFTPKHPKTKPTPELLEETEAVIDWTELLKIAAETAEIRYISLREDAE
ncbi:MAG: tRNA 4-thiouridine(8) synthase ThiI [Clostridia bacterium]|nr:tRNA 4-thiouridine(8) synthase ThiI [Clostridia bacterium]